MKITFLQKTGLPVSLSSFTLPTCGEGASSKVKSGVRNQYEITSHQSDQKGWDANLYVHVLTSRLKIPSRPPRLAEKMSIFVNGVSKSTFPILALDLHITVTSRLRRALVECDVGSASKLWSKHWVRYPKCLVFSVAVVGCDLIALCPIHKPGKNPSFPVTWHHSPGILCG